MKPIYIKNEPPETNVDERVYEEITRYTVGFLVLTEDGNGKPIYKPCGSGVLVNIGEMKGILTAAHVILEIEKFPHAILFAITRKGKDAVPLRFFPKLLSRVLLGGENRSPDGPDLAFMEIPLEIRGGVLSECNFYNFELRYRHAGTSEEPLDAHLLSGVLAERSETKLLTDEVRRDQHTMVHGGGYYDNERVVADGHRLFDFHFAHNEDVRRPNTYGGLSGSAVWRTDCKGGRDDRLVFGIAFYESDVDENGERTIICHGPESIYNKLVDKMQNHFGNAMKKIN